ncbi:hypothetical protein DID80_03760 [Candidatus Marinamargulisbacteria bacterium SCGC AAA071-K20]|nr:hypothetical protein DID80_03760 [Candidatus Marinamargulisbacteria bacterium SCGC AAA071-K20]
MRFRCDRTISSCGKASSSNSSSDDPQTDQSTVSQIEVDGRTYQEGSSLIQTTFESEEAVSANFIVITPTVVETTDGTVVSIPISASDLGLTGDESITVSFTVQD